MVASDEHAHTPDHGRGHVNRDRLVTTMLQDRSVVRIISAPSGYGKTELAREYADRLFRGKRVDWVDANTPDFIARLDERRVVRAMFANSDEPTLLVLDDIPWLHEQRAELLSDQIDAALYAGAEVVVTCLPSHDCLRNLQAERILVRPRDLAVSQREYDAWVDELEGLEHVHGVERWRDARAGLFGETPLAVWGACPDVARTCLRSFLCEKLPNSVFRAAFAMMLLEQGTFRDLDALGAMPTGEELLMLADDYGFLHIDLEAQRFQVPSVELEVLKGVIDDADMGRILLSETDTMMERMLSKLVEDDRVMRVQEMLSTFYSEQRCVSWARKSGWRLLDRNETALVDMLLDMAPPGQGRELPELVVMRAWCAGLEGNAVEAAYFARKFLQQSADEDEWPLRTLARIALSAFDSGGPGLHASFETPPRRMPENGLEFLCQVVSMVGPNVTGRAFKTDAHQREELKASYEEVDAGKVNALTALFTSCHDRFAGDQFYRLALHVLCCADSAELRQLVQRLGSALVFETRKSGIHSFSEALLIRDVWNTGFFGMAGRRADRKDVVLLQSATRYLRLLAEATHDEDMTIPWDMRVSTLESPRKKSAAASGIEPVRINVFGSFEVIKGDTCIPESKWKRRTRNLLTLLVLYQGRSMPRTTLLQQMWPDLSRVRALDNFYSVWSDATKLIGGEPYLEKNGDFCRINTRYVRSDLEDIEQLSRAIIVGHPDPAVLLDSHMSLEKLYRGGLAINETENKVIISQRERYRATYVDSMLSGAELSLSRKDTRMALWFARKAMAEERSREDVYQVLMRAQMQAGQRCSAIRTFFEYRKFMKAELGLDPSAEMQSLYDSLIVSDPSLLRIDPRIVEL